MDDNPEDKKVDEEKPLPRLIRCNVLSCPNSSRSKEGLRFYCFPERDPLKCSEWCGVVGFPQNKLRPYHRVCGDHFQKEDFTPDFSDLMPEYHVGKRRKLVKGVVPSLKLPEPDVATRGAASNTVPNAGIYRAPKKNVEGEEEEATGTGTESGIIEPESEPSEAQVESPEPTPPPPKKLKLQQVQEPARPTRSSQPRGQGPCLICSKEGEKRHPELYTFTGSNGFSPLNQQLWSTFVLRKLLKLPVWKYEEVLRKSGSSTNPGDWFLMCGGCEGIVNDILEMQEQIRILDFKVSKQIKAFGRKCIENVRKVSSSKNSYSRCIYSARDEIRAFIKESSHGSQMMDSKRPSSEAAYDVRKILETISGNPDAVDTANISSDHEYEDGYGVDNEIPEHDDNNMSDEEKEEKEDESEKSACDKVSEEDAEWLPHPVVFSVEEIASANGQKNSDTILDDDDMDSDDDPNPKPKRKTAKLSKSRPPQARGMGRFQCKICLRKYQRQGQHTTHMKLHAQTKKLYDGAFDCFKCKAPYGTKKSLQYHFRSEHCMRLHHTWNVSLPQEDYTYTRKTKTEVISRLTLHHNIAEIFECKHCPRKFSSASGLRNHAGSHKASKQLHDGRLDCSQCKMPFTAVKSLRSHLKKDHQLILDIGWNESTPQEGSMKQLVNEGGNEDHKCPKCETEFKMKKAYDDHMKMHESTPESRHCQKCQRPWSSATALKAHLRCAHGIVDSCNICELCGFSAKTPTILKEHKIKHIIFDGSVDTAISTTHFVCTICKELFKTRRVLSLHRVRAHAEELDIEVFRCTEDGCDKAFLRKLALVDHIAEKHKNAAKFQCDECGYRARNRHRLTAHMDKHKKHRTPHMCEYCSATYFHISGFRDHMIKYHPDKYQPQKQNYFTGVPIEKLDTEYGHGGLPMGTTGFKRPLKEIPCKYCDSVLPHKLALKQHFNTAHKDMFSWTCDLCERVYMSEQSLKLHKKINHSTATDVTCGWCLKTVSHRLKLYDHKNFCTKRPKGPDVPKIFILEGNPSQESAQASDDGN